MNEEYKILLIEDEPDLAEIFSAALKAAGFTIEVIKDGSDAIKTIKKMKPDLILLDIVLPKKDGYEILKEIKCGKVIDDSRVYVFSNLTQADEIKKAIKLGAEDFLIKSDYTPSKLVKKVNEIFCLKGYAQCCNKKD